MATVVTVTGSCCTDGSAACHLLVSCLPPAGCTGCLLEATVLKATPRLGMLLDVLRLLSRLGSSVFKPLCKSHIGGPKCITSLSRHQTFCAPCIGSLGLVVANCYAVTWAQGNPGRTVPRPSHACLPCLLASPFPSPCLPCQPWPRRLPLSLPYLGCLSPTMLYSTPPQGYTCQRHCALRWINGSGSSSSQRGSSWASPFPPTP